MKLVVTPDPTRNFQSAALSREAPIFAASGQRSLYILSYLPACVFYPSKRRGQPRRGAGVRRGSRGGGGAPRGLQVAVVGGGQGWEGWWWRAGVREGGEKKRREERRERERGGGRGVEVSGHMFYLYFMMSSVTGRKHREPFPSVQCETKFSTHRNQASHIFSPRNHYNVFGFDPQQLKLQVCEEYIQSSVGLWVVYCGHMNWST